MSPAGEPTELPAPIPPPAGRRGAMLGDYELGAKIGEGSMGTVYLGTDLVHQRPVAIKFLTQLGENPHALARFQREVQIALRMRHDHIVRGHAAGVWEGCIHYFVMEYVDGVTLTEYMARERLTETKGIEIVAQMARALAYINEFGLVHRDLKPENVMLTRDGVAKITDLGLAKTAEGDTELTMAGAVVGTPLYMSPEQARGASALDIRSDLYSLGATFYHLLTGTPPFKGQSAPEVIAKQIHEDPVPPRDLDPTLSVGVQYVVLKCLQKDPGKRYQTPEALLVDLELLQAGKGGPGEEGTPWADDAETPAQAFPEAFLPPEEDVRFAAAAVANNVMDRATVEGLLDAQEGLARGGVALRLSWLAVERGACPAEKVRRLETALRERRDTEGEALFGRLAVRHKIATEEQVQACLADQAARRAEGRPLRIAELLQQKGVCTPEQVDGVLASQRRARAGKEDEEVLTLAQATGLISDAQAERGRLIHGNQVTMGHYRPVGDVLVERRYLAPDAAVALLRAVRRAKVLQRPPAELLALHRQAGPTATPPDDATVAGYRDQIADHVRRGLAARKAYRYYDAIAAWERVLESVSAHPDAERHIEETRALLADLEARKARGQRMAAQALAEWEAYRRLNPVDGRLGEAIAVVQQRLARLDGAARAAGSATARAAAPPRPAAAPAPAPPRDLAAETATAADMPAPDRADAAVAEADPEAARADRLLRQAQRAEEAGRRGEARDRFAEALAAAPDHPDAVDGLARLDRSARRREWFAVCVVLLVLVGGGAAAVAAVGRPQAEARVYRWLGGLS